MQLRKLYIYIVCLIIGILPQKETCAQSSSYIYIELIKNIPCKVIQNGVDVIQYNKNYVFLYGEDNTEQKIDIEFGANLYPKQSFVIDLTPNKSFAYKLSKSSETSFYLIDLVNNGKVVESNTNTNIGIATTLNQIHFSENTPIYTKSENTQKSVSILKKIKKEKTEEKEDKTIHKEHVYGIIEEYNNKETIQTVKADKTEKENNPIEIINTQELRKGCNFIAINSTIEIFLQKLKSKRTEEDKLILIRRNQIKGCLTQEQISNIVSEFSSQYSRFEALKILSNQAAYPNQLIEAENLLKAQNYKAKFVDFVNGLNF